MVILYSKDIKKYLTFRNRGFTNLFERQRDSFLFMFSNVDQVFFCHLSSLHSVNDFLFPFCPSIVEVVCFQFLISGTERQITSFFLIKLLICQMCIFICQM